MKAIIIAAGLGKRLAPLTNDVPKCLLPVGETTILANTIDLLRSNGVIDIAIVVGYCADKIQIPDIKYYYNDDYQNNNILHSLMYAKNFMDDEVIITYADTWLEAEAIEKVISTPGEIVASVDLDWEQAYQVRTDNPVADAEMVILDSETNTLQIGKNILNNHLQGNGNTVGEFMGLVKLSKSSIIKFKQTYKQLDSQIMQTGTASQIKDWQNMYLSDFLNVLLSHNLSISASCHHGGWMEIDTVQDYEILLKKMD